MIYYQYREHTCSCVSLKFPRNVSRDRLLVLQQVLHALLRLGAPLLRVERVHAEGAEDALLPQQTEVGGDGTQASRRLTSADRGEIQYDGAEFTLTGDLRVNGTLYADTCQCNTLSSP